MHKLKQTSENRNVEGQEQHLPQGSTILGGRYCLLQLLYQRPRLNLYLGQRISSPQLGARGNTYRGKEQGPVVAIRELVLTNLPLILLSVTLRRLRWRRRWKTFRNSPR